MIDWLRGNPEPSLDIAGRTVPLAIKRHPTAKRMTLRLAPDGSEARITMPRWGRTGDAVDFAASRSQWIAGQLARIPQAARADDGSVLSFRGDPLILTWQQDAPRSPVVDDGELLVGGPRENIAARAQRWMECQALELMRGDLAFYCGRAGLACPEIRLSRAQRRWGSCSAKGMVRINWRLIQAADHVRRSVVAHEVAHLVHFDHSPQFHALLGTLFEGDLAAADSWLSRHGRSLYSSFG
ncbi:hypothetical protein HME9302_00267 [Alteripontixanthobacter maritimus]|uniref:YgjP-like metallopeptidase domain-containing protein n=1 Tax=Alteripontixanthobacter maritimus TaxID=2161824 RepID=A0A369Q9W8_9SPHN|nr:YgjP-like metallopeptidase domain-containing protein [Alteripontixanthobacter maritimus]RDC59088.1 hypothetical protein HME9302_00267 [Alteripontixanthobacter maritimus]